MIYPLILYGGMKTRLWQVSCESMTKQSVRLMDAKRSTFRASFTVLSGRGRVRQTYCDRLGRGSVHLGRAMRPTRDRSPHRAAPYSLDSAAVAVATLHAVAVDPHAVVLIMAAERKKLSFCK